MKNELLYGELMLVDKSHLIIRYNKALKKACGIETKLESFHIDCSGYSPEIAAEFKDADYLNSNGVNKRFIIISIKQKDLPIARSHFSSTAEFLKNFMSDNYSCLLTLTALDSVYGELENNIYRIKTLEDIINADRVSIKIDTPNKIIETSISLDNKIKNLSESDDLSWLEEDNIQEIIHLVKKTGDIRYNKLSPEHISYKKTCFFTRHMGGMYVFKGYPENKVTIIPVKRLINVQIPSNVDIIDIGKIDSIYDFLKKNDFISDLDLQVVAANKEALREKKYQIVIDHMVNTGKKTYGESIDPYDIKHFIQENFEKLPDTFTKFYKILAEIERDDDIEEIDSTLVFYLCQTSETEHGKSNMLMVKHLMANYTPYSYKSVFQYNRELFMKQYSAWSNEKKEYIEGYLLDNLENLKSRSQAG